MSERALRNPRKGYVRDFSDYDIDLETFVHEVVLPDCPPPVFRARAFDGRRRCCCARPIKGHRWFDRMVLLAPMIALPGMRRSIATRAAVKAMRLIGLGGAYVPGGDASVMMQRPFIGNLLTSDPVRYARNVAVLEAEPTLAIGWPTVGWTDSAFKVMREFADPGYPAKIRQPMLVVAAGQDEIVSTPAIDEFAIRLRAGSHLIVPGAPPRTADGAGPLPHAGAGRLRRLRAGNAAF